MLNNKNEFVAGGTSANRTSMDNTGGQGLLYSHHDKRPMIEQHQGKNYKS